MVDAVTRFGFYEEDQPVSSSAAALLYAAGMRAVVCRVTSSPLYFLVSNSRP